MCGIAGCWKPAVFRSDEAGKWAGIMAAQIAHRGPDDWGVWSDSDQSLAMAHRRLAVVDLSPAGHQPMVSSCERYVIVFNGEIYNHLDLRRKLHSTGSSPSWRGHSDTESLVEAIAAMGLEATLEAAVGMFAFGLWDRLTRTLTLARDRMGEKPLYYGRQGGSFLFGSELKALEAHPDFTGAVDRAALALLLRHNYIPAPHSIYQGICKLPPGTLLEIRAGEPESAPRPYWSLRSVAEAGAATPLQLTDADALEGLEAILARAIQDQSVADVPLGALLSGGVDSSVIVALMQARSTRPVRTFTIGFDERDHDESRHAAAVARHLGTEHTEIVLSPRDALELIPGIPRIYDEPFADSSQLPTQLVMQAARRDVTVALSGDGGDELFGGYNRYRMAPRLWRGLRWVPMAMRQILASAVLALSAERWDALAGRSPVARGVAHPGQKMHKLAQRLLTPRDFNDLFVALASEWPQPESAVLSAGTASTGLNSRSDWPELEDDVARMMALDALTYLPDDILVKVDRAAMSTSLETRAPFLDHRVVEYAWRLPMALKLRAGQGKWLLRQVLDRYVPRNLTERPKMGFAIPLDAWLRGPLRDWAEALLDEARLRKEGYFEPSTIRAIWQAHLHRGQSFGQRLWSVLMFQAWLETR